MISAVHPDVLRNSLRNRLRLDKIDCRSDLQKFFKFMVETLKSYRLFNPVLSGSVTSSVPARHSGSAVTRQPRHVQCFHCQQPHHIKECPTCPPDVAARIMRDFSTHHTRSPANKPVSSGSNTATNSLPPKTPYRSPAQQRSFSSPTFPSLAATRPPVRPQANSDQFASASPASVGASQQDHQRFSANRLSTVTSEYDHDHWSKPSIPSPFHSPFPSGVEDLFSRALEASIDDDSAPARRINQMSSDYVRESVSRLTSVRIEIDGKYFEFPAALDDGADITLLGSNVWFVIADTGIVTANVSLPFKLANGSTACAIRSASVDLHLQTSAGPAIARSSQVYFADGPLPDILLGRPLLLSLGINVEQQLCDLADRQKPDGEGEEVFDHRDIEHLGFGVSDNAEVEKALTHAVTLAAEQAPAPFVSALRTLLFEFVDVFRVKLGPDPPIDIEPALIELLPTAIPAHCKPRHMPPLYRDFLSQHFSQLVESGYGFMNPSSSWSSPAFCVPKPGANRYLRSVCDLRYSNSQMK